MSFADELKNIHTGISPEDQSDTDPLNISYITINKDRQLVPDTGFNTTIAYEGDINTQIITFVCLKEYDGHSLENCNNKVVRWKNIASGAEGISNLTVNTDYSDFRLAWEVPAEACTTAGTLEISIEIFDMSNNKKVFSWNTANYSGLQIGKSMNSVSTGNTIPTDQILIVNEDTKDIVAPLGYNNVLCNYGEKGLTKVYFLVSEEVFDIIGSEPALNVCVRMNGYFGTESNIDVEDYIIKGKKLVTWTVSEAVTAGAAGPGSLQIALTITNPNKIWSTNVYNNLKVNESIILGGNSGDAELTTDIIKKYFEEHSFIIDAN